MAPPKKSPKKEIITKPKIANKKPAKPMPKKSPPKKSSWKSIPKKSPPTSPKKGTTTVKKTLLSRTVTPATSLTLKMSATKKTPKKSKEVSSNDKKKEVSKDTRTSAGPKNTPKRKFTVVKAQYPGRKSNSKPKTSKFTVIKTHPPKKPPKTTLSDYTMTTLTTTAAAATTAIMAATTTPPHTSPNEYFTTTIYPTITSFPVNVTYLNIDMVTTQEPLLWYYDDTAYTTSSPIQYFEDATLPSGTMPYIDGTLVSSGDMAVTSGTILSGDYISGGVATDTTVLDDGLTVVIPAVTSEDMGDFVSSPWQDLSEYIPVDVPVTTFYPTTAPLTTRPPVINTNAVVLTSAFTENENNMIDMHYNRAVPLDNDISEDNLISKHRVNLRERTKNKRIQELLEEKRNFLLRMKRGHSKR